MSRAIYETDGQYSEVARQTAYKNHYKRLAKIRGWVISALSFVLGVLAVLVLTGCASTTPYVAARHIDATPMAGGSDAWDVGCLGAKYRRQVELKAGYCLNARGGNMFEFSVEYDLWER